MLKYQVNATSIAHTGANFQANGDAHAFGLGSENDLASPADLLLGAFSACVLKNVERFSSILNFEYDSAEVEVFGERSDKPPQISSIQYVLKIKSADPKLNPKLLMKNISKFGTIYNTLASVAKISGTIEIIK